MGRRRKHLDSIPGHIDQSKLPAGIYWDASGRGRWYIVGVTGRSTVAGRDAKLSDLHAIAEARQGHAAQGSLARLMLEFSASLAYAGLAPRTRSDYDAYRRQITDHPLPDGTRLGVLQHRLLRPPAIRRLIDSIGGKHPTKANHWLRYLRRVFAWGIEYGHCQQNPCVGVRQLRERAAHRMPELVTFRAVQAFAAARGALPSRAPGSVAPYLAPAMEIAYQCRLRGIEVITLTDANIGAGVILTNRRKGSRDNATRIGPALSAAIAALQARRAGILAKLKRATQLRPEARPLIITERGEPLSRSAWDNSWQRLMKLAIAESIITVDQRFGLHGLKHRGITDTAGGIDAKQAASGHKTPAMVHRYDHTLPAVEPTADALSDAQVAGKST